MLCEPDLSDVIPCIHIPIQRDGHSADPSSYQSTDGSTKDLIDGSSQGTDFDPFGSVDTMDVEKGVCGEERDVQTTVQSVDLVRGERGAEENKDDGDDWSSEGDGQDEGEDTRLGNICQEHVRRGREQSCTHHQLCADASVTRAGVGLLLLAPLRQLVVVAAGNAKDEVQELNDGHTNGGLRQSLDGILD